MRYEEYIRTPEAVWFSTVPADWRATKMREVFSERNTKVSDKDYPALSVGKMGVTPQLDTAVKTDNGDNRKLICNGDFAINSRSDRKGSSGISQYDGSASLIITVLKPHHELNGKFYHYLLRSHYFVEEFYRNGHGLVSDLWTTKWDEMRNIYIPVPPREEQDQIVRYLDWKVSCINKLIHGYQRQIKLLEERRHSIVENYILKDCNEYRTMALHYAAEFIVDCPHETPLYDPDGCYYVIRTADEGYGELRTDDVMYKLQEKEYKKRTRRARLNKGDIVYGREGERWGLACLVPESNKYCLGQRMIQIRCNTKFLLPEYAVWLLNANYVYHQGYVEMLGSTSPHVNVATIGSYRIKVPSLDKQKEIAAYINVQMDNINDAVRHIEKEIALLKEYRTRLISDVVTGQMDVRGVVVPDYTPEDDTVESEADEKTTDEEVSMDAD